MDDMDVSGTKPTQEAKLFSWRTEPVISVERQQFLVQRRSVSSDIRMGTYPFRDIKLSRADVEWLLATHESDGMRGPVDVADEAHQTRVGLDLRGAILSGEDLSRLPLARTIGGIPSRDWFATTPDQRVMAAIHLEGAKLTPEVHIEESELGGAYLERADCNSAHFERSYLREAHLERTYFRFAHLEGSNLRLAHLEGTNFRSAHLQRAVLSESFLDSATTLNGSIMASSKQDGVVLADVRWNGTNLAVLNWYLLSMLGDERSAYHPNEFGESGIPATEQLLSAVRAYRQLSVTLRNQGLSEAADRFAYRAQLVQRKVLWRQGRYIRALGSLLLDMISGYGYRPLRSLVTYFLIICIFAGAYLVNAQFAAPHLTWDESLVLSVSSFNGRGFFTSGVSLEPVVD